MEQKKRFDVIFFLIDRERIEKVERFYRKLRYSQMHSNPGATLKIPQFVNIKLKIPLNKTLKYKLYSQSKKEMKVSVV